MFQRFVHQQPQQYPHFYYSQQKTKTNFIFSVKCSMDLHCRECCSKFHHELDKKSQNHEFKETMTGSTIIEQKKIKTQRQTQLESLLLSLKLQCEKKIEEKNKQIKGLQKICSLLQKQNEQVEQLKQRTNKSFRKQIQDLEIKVTSLQLNYEDKTIKMKDLKQKYVSNLQVRKNNYILNLSKIKKQYNHLIQNLLLRYEFANKKIIDLESLNFKNHHLLIRLADENKIKYKNDEQKLIENQKNQIAIQKEKAFSKELAQLVLQFVSLNSINSSFHNNISSILSQANESFWRESVHRVSQQYLEDEQEIFNVTQPLTPSSLILYNNWRNTRMNQQQQSQMRREQM